VADHILTLTFTITLYVKENYKAASFSDGKLGAREDTIEPKPVLRRSFHVLCSNTRVPWQL
jgi:hypothetical protein